MDSKLLCATALMASAAAMGVCGPAAAEIEELTISVIGAPSSVNAWNRVHATKHGIAEAEAESVVSHGRIVRSG